MLICGKPGSGKTLLIKELMNNPMLFKKKFDYVFVISPSAREFRDLYLFPSNYSEALDWTWVESKIKQLCEIETEYINVLFIMDDCIGSLKRDMYDEKMLNFLFNRRHKLNKGVISIIVTAVSKKYLL